MQDDNWELINGPDAHEIEVLNYTNQINVIEALLKLFVHHGGTGQGGCPLIPNSETLRELHRTGTLFLLKKPGEYRDSEVVVGKGDVVIYTPPAAAEVPARMEEFQLELVERWRESDPVEVAAFVLWKINWVHPFKNGNGRTARAFAYACLCLKVGFLLPGAPTVLDLIMNNRDAYYAALRTADETYAESGTPDLTEMNRYLTELLMLQLQTVPANASESLA